MIPFFQSEFDALQVSYNWLGEIPPTGDFGDFWWLFWLKNPIFRRDFEIGHNLGVSVYLPMPKNRKSSFGHAPAQNRAHISSVHMSRVSSKKEVIFYRLKNLRDLSQSIDNLGNLRLIKKTH